MNRDLGIYALHIGFWSAFIVTRMLRTPAAKTEPAVAGQLVTAPFSRTLLGVHTGAFGILYFALGNAVIPSRVPAWFGWQRFVGAIIIVAGGALACWALLSFRSWRLRAQLDAGHALATGGPFALVRHPIYAGLDLLALGTAVWVPTPLLGVAAVLVIIGSDLRGRAEERILAQAFGAQYEEYRKHTRRLVPGLY